MQQEVIIVGGMVGLSLALMLAKSNIAVKLLEAIQYPNYDDANLAPYHSSFDARNSALSRRSVTNLPRARFMGCLARTCYAYFRSSNYRTRQVLARHVYWPNKEKVEALVR